MHGGCTKHVLPLLALVLLNRISTAHAQPWTLTSATNANWKLLVASSDGTALAAVQGANPFGSSGSIIRSTDSGNTWAPVVASPNIAWATIACAANGARFVGGNADKLYTMSTVPSPTWRIEDTNFAGELPFNSAASSADGSTFLVGNGSTEANPPHLTAGALLISTDSGTTWTTNNLSASIWFAVAVSGDGGTLAAAQSGGRIYFSTDSGNTWFTNNSPLEKWQSLALSDNGTVLAGAVSNGFIYITTDLGMTWQTNDAPSALWRSIAMSADGTKMIAGGNNGIYTSTNSGAHWVSNSAPNHVWTSVVSSSDGSKLAAASSDVGSNGSIYTWQQLPTLSFASVNGGFLFSWPYLSSTTNYVLQQNSILTGTNWSAVPGLPGITNGQYQVVVPLPSGDEFYRLQKSP